MRTATSTCGQASSTILELGRATFIDFGITPLTIVALHNFKKSHDK
jgi:hypothetical protein